MFLNQIFVRSDWAIPATVFALLLTAYLKRRRCALNLPIINSYSGDYLRRRAYGDYATCARKLLSDGLKNVGGPFQILTPLGSRLILPPEYATWVRPKETLSHSAIVMHEYLAWVPGFEGNHVIHEPNQIVVDVTRTKLSQNGESIATMHQHLVEVLSGSWTDSKDWHSVGLADASLNIISRMAAAVFVGPVLARDAAWQELTKTYTVNMFMGVRSLRWFPAWLRPLAHWFVAECMACRAQVKLARQKIHGELKRREEEHKSDLASGKKPAEYKDALIWIDADARKKKHAIDPAHAQLAFAIAALHTTTQLLQQTLIDLCKNPQLLEALRGEIRTALNDGDGWTLKSLAKMELLDSCIKETQRLKPGALVNLERQALADVTLPNGVTVPRGTNIAVDTSVMWDENVFPEPQKYDGYRFLRQRTADPSSASKTQVVSSSEHHFAFGWGRGICPGRFLVASEVKVAVAEILTSYDIRLKRGTPDAVLELGFEMLSNPAAELEIRAR